MGVASKQAKVGINLATSGSWGTSAAVATAVGAGDGVYVRDDLNLQLKRTVVEDDSMAQHFIGSVQAARTEAIQATVPIYLHYLDAFMNPLWALAFGTGGTSPTQLSTSTCYTNTFEPATNKTGRYATIVRDKVQYISEIPGAKFTGFELRVGENGRIEVDFNFIGDVEKSDSAINTSTQVSALTFPTLGYRAFFSDLVFRLNAQAGGALANSDALMITNLKVTFTQPLDTKFVGGQHTLIEPEENGIPSVMLDITFARFDSASDDFFAAHRDVTKYKGDITLTGPVITGSTTYKLVFQFPHLYVPEFKAPLPASGGQVAPSMRLKALATTTAPTGMTGVTVPIRLVTTGTSSSNPFV
jgi:hypothetical protein